MPFEIIRHDLLKLNVDAIVNPTNPERYKGRAFSVSGKIEEAVGNERIDEIYRSIKYLPFGKAVLSEAPNLIAKHIIHVSTPHFSTVDPGSEETLRLCYRNTLMLAEESKLTSIAFPLLSAGSHQFPKDKALNIALTEIQSFLMDSDLNDLMVYLVVYDSSAYKLTKKLNVSIKSYIDENYIEESVLEINSTSYLKSEFKTKIFKSEEAGDSFKTLNDRLHEQDTPFAQALLDCIDQKGFTDVEVYKRANVSKAVFSKIRSNAMYQPSKTTALAFCIALKLNLEEASELINRAGFSFTNTSKLDIIVKYFIEEKSYDIISINTSLYKYDLPLLGSHA